MYGKFSSYSLFSNKIEKLLVPTFDIWQIFKFDGRPTRSILPCGLWDPVFDEPYGIYYPMAPGTVETDSKV